MVVVEDFEEVSLVGWYCAGEMCMKGTWEAVGASACEFAGASVADVEVADGFEGGNDPWRNMAVGVGKLLRPLFQPNLPHRQVYLSFCLESCFAG